MTYEYFKKDAGFNFLFPVIPGFRTRCSPVYLRGYFKVPVLSVFLRGTCRCTYTSDASAGRSPSSGTIVPATVSCENPVNGKRSRMPAGIGILPDENEKIFGSGSWKNTGPGLFLVHENLGITRNSISGNGEPGSGSRLEIVNPPGTYRHPPAGVPGPVDTVTRKYYHSRGMVHAG